MRKEISKRYSPDTENKITRIKNIYVAINAPRHTNDDIRVSYKNEKYIWTCSCENHARVHPYTTENAMKKHTAGKKHTRLLDGRDNFRSAAREFWKKHNLEDLKLEISKTHRLATCLYCNLQIKLTKAAFKTHIRSETHLESVDSFPKATPVAKVDTGRSSRKRRDPESESQDSSFVLNEEEDDINKVIDVCSSPAVKEEDQKEQEDREEQDEEMEKEEEEEENAPAKPVQVQVQMPVHKEKPARTREWARKSSWSHSSPTPAPSAPKKTKVAQPEPSLETQMLNAIYKKGIQQIENDEHNEKIKKTVEEFIDEKFKLALNNLFK